ncbi:hypothetical protein [Glycomyces xiaoerkulensis]|uniref:hypothetical protein n=1 Tax=Glycomyces xiaoerkulensis TaxID=2038139 RepID=UPI0018E43BE4|nr:hypothetical protein [Glycomyces xiaoerkulensis]
MTTRRRLLDLFCCAGGAAMGIDWTDDRTELVEAIPPAYTDCIGTRLAHSPLVGAPPAPATT